MANYRQIHVSIWKDEWFLDLNSEEKLLFIYLFSNESASLSGIYKLALRVIAFETGLDLDLVRELLIKFEKAEKVYYRTGIIWVKNMRRYNRGSSKVDTRIQIDIDEIPDCEIKRMYLAYYGEKENIPEPKDDNLPAATGEIPHTEEEIPYPYPIDRVSNEMNGSEGKGNESEMDEDSEEANTNGASAPGVPPPTPTPSGRDDLLVNKTPGGRILIAELTFAFRGTNKRAFEYYANARQRDQYLETFQALNSHLTELIQKGIGRERTNRATMLSWLQACAKPSTNGSRASPQDTTHDTLARMRKELADNGE